MSLVIWWVQRDPAACRVLHARALPPSDTNMPKTTTGELVYSALWGSGTILCAGCTQLVGDLETRGTKQNGIPTHRASRLLRKSETPYNYTKLPSLREITTRPRRMGLAESGFETSDMALMRDGCMPLPISLDFQTGGRR